ncbi:MAG: carboxylate--amine ligase [Actinomycetia bacterium]|nr:carboxylate--amine ligase [Actinomycetes bacterium]
MAAGTLQPVILGADIAAYSLARAFHEAYGITSISLSTNDIKYVSSSRFIDHRTVPALEDEDRLIETLVGLARDLGGAKQLIVLGCGDWYIRHLSRHKGELEQAGYLVPYIDFDLLDRITLKDEFYADCARLGVDYPTTWVFDCADPTVVIPADDFTYPVVAKPSNTARYHYASFPGKKKAFIVKSADELRTIFAHLQASTYDKQLIVQDFIPGGDDNMRVLTCYGDESGEVTLAAFGRVLQEDHGIMAIGNPIVIVNERSDAVVAQAARLMKDWGYHGFANFDIKYDPRDGTYRFFEVNTRLGRSNYYVTGAGTNVVSWLVDDLVLHRPAPKTMVVVDEEHLFSCLPAYVIRRTVGDRAQVGRAMRLMRTGKWSFPLWYARDGWRQRFWATLTFYNRIPKYWRERRAG